MATKLTTDILGLDNATQAVEFTVGTGDPNGVVTAVTGSIFVDATTPGLYQNDAGGTAWTAVGGGGGGGWPTTVGTDYAGTPYEQAQVAATNGDLIVSPNGNGALIASVPDGTAAGGNTRGIYATDLQRIRSAATEVASGNYSTISGGREGRANGLYATIGGGYRSTASGSYCTVGGGDNNTASNSWCTVGGGDNNTASNSWCTVGGGYDNTASATRSTVGGGYRNTASGQYATVGGGQRNQAVSPGATVSGGYGNNASGTYQPTIGGGRSNTASGTYQATVSGGYVNATSANGATIGGGSRNLASGGSSTVSGGSYGLADHAGEFAYASGRFAATGDAQYSRIVLRRQTVDATPTELSANGNAPSGNTRLSLANETAYKFQIDLVAKEANAANAAWWQISGCILRDATAASTILVGTPTVTTDNTGTGTAATWSVAVTADTTNGALAITVTGAAATIRWVAVVHSSKVGAP